MNLELNCEGFEDFLVKIESSCGGIHYVFEFENGYGASVVKHDFSYGSGEDLWELAVLHRGDICYSSPITSDVLGYLDDGEVLETLEEIKNL